MRRFIPLLAVAALVVVLSGSADAGVVVQSQLTVTPNPATTAQPITIGNAPGDANTCEDGVVTYLVMKSDGEARSPSARSIPAPTGTGRSIDPIPVAGIHRVGRLRAGRQPDSPAGSVGRFPVPDVELVVTDAVVPSSSTTAAPGASTRRPSPADGAALRIHSDRHRSRTRPADGASGAGWWSFPTSAAFGRCSMTSARLSAENGWTVCVRRVAAAREQNIEWRLGHVGDLVDQEVMNDAITAADSTGAEEVSIIGFCMGGMYAQAAGTGRFWRPPPSG
jgi:hypothetical protein